MTKKTYAVAVNANHEDYTTKVIVFDSECLPTNARIVKNHIRFYHNDTDYNELAILFSNLTQTVAHRYKHNFLDMYELQAYTQVS